MVTSLMAGLGLGIFLSLSVGPVIFAIIKYSLSGGFKAGLSFALGVSFSDTMYVVLGNVASSFIYELGEMKHAIGIIGGFVLIGMGVYGLFFKETRINAGESRPIETIKTPYFRIWLSGYLMNTLNPAVLLFWLGICTANSALDTQNRLALFGTTLAFVLSADISKVFLANKIRHKLTLKTVGRLNRIAAVSMILFGSILLYTVIFHTRKI